MLPFQNCAQQPGFESEEETTDQSSEGTTFKYTDTPFAFDASINQVTYMSCSFDPDLQSSCPANTQCAPENISNRSAFFTFRMGAYDQISSQTTGAFKASGVKFTDEFNAYIKELLRAPGTKAGDVTAEEYFDVISSSEENMGAKIQFSLRNVFESRVGLISQSQGGAVEGNDFASALTPLSDPAVILPMANNRLNTMNFFALNSFVPDQRSLEASLYYNFNYNTLEEIIANISDIGLMLTYTPKEAEMAAGANVARAPSSLPNTEFKKAYGKKYLMSFEGKFGNNDFNTTPNGMLEYDLLSGRQSLDTWDCNAVPKYVIVKPADAVRFPSLCPPSTVSELSSDKNRLEYEVLRRHLKSNDWTINVVKKCIVPKVQGDCYKTYVGAVPNKPPVEVAYGNVCKIDPITNACAKDASGNPIMLTPIQACGKGTPYDCPQYVKTCLKR